MLAERARTYVEPTSLVELRQNSLIDVAITSAPVLDGFTLTERTLRLSARSVRVRVYRPDDADDGALPTLVWFPGGGFVAGGPHTVADLCAGLCVEAGIQVVCAGYALGPEHRWPSGHDDALAVLEWLMESPSRHGIDPARVLVGGDSAGGHVAAHTALRWNGRELLGQVLVYPVIRPVQATESYREFAEGYGLTAADMAWFLEQYGPFDASALPFDLLSAEVLKAIESPGSGGCPAYVVTAECDVLRDEGEAYAAALVQAGVPARVTRYEGAPHGFFQMTTVSSVAREAFSDCARYLKSVTTSEVGHA